ncbi:hypothetical protein BCR44DRAFT_1512182 [Catenaria anguillulae PL171]|uniref:Tyrosinase copper-binding domain-containing protein n=1 Tax=Catenaria anguillulae PL171 TaxID=765915 RepID=A0A1Y2HSP2_9FUNG|nr:hypothetical protein BCR44DRAFT_1512182 [Catenaria anguillulae PL171]
MHSTRRILSILSLVVVVAVLAAAQCPKKLRKEVRDLSTAELAALHKAFWKLNRNGSMAKYTRLHVEHKDKGHFNPSFLPFHRAMLVAFEDELIAASDGVLTGLPFWDSTFDAKDPAKSPILAPDFFGNAKTGCISDGPYVGLKREDGSCVRRNLIPGPWNLDQPMIVSIMRLYAESFDQFAYYLERGPHFVVHSNIGGDLFTLVDAPNDPLFYMHHSFIEYIWTKWQSANPKAATAYGGDANGRTYTANDQVMSWRVGDMLDHRNHPRLCYSYQDAKWPKDGIASRKNNSTQPPPTNSSSSGVISDFQPLPDAFLAEWKIPKEQMAAANRLFASVIKALQRMQQDGKPLPTLADLKDPSKLNDFEKGIRGNQEVGAAAPGNAASSPPSAALTGAQVSQVVCGVAIVMGVMMGMMV